jgi:hypothetical protein
MRTWRFVCGRSILSVLLFLALFADSACHRRSFAEAMNNADVERIKELLEKEPRLANQPIEKDEANGIRSDEAPLVVALNQCRGNAGVAIVEALVKHGASLTAGPSRKSPLSAALACNPKLADYLVERGASLVDSNALSTSASRGLTEWAKRLVVAGTSAKSDRTLLHYAARSRQVAGSVPLPDLGHSPIGFRRGVGAPLPLRYVPEAGPQVFASSPAIVQLLVEAGADVNGVDYNGDTPLHIAAAGGFAGIAAYLLAHGADPTIRNKHGEQPLDVALEEQAKVGDREVRSSRLELIDILKQAVAARQEPRPNKRPRRSSGDPLMRAY